MKDELERLKRDRNEAENELQWIEDELRAYEDAHPEDYEDHDDWDNLHREALEKENWISYLNACIKSIELGYED